MQNKFNINDRVRNKFSKREGYVYSQNPLMVMYNFTQVPIGVSQEHIEFIEEDVCSEHTDAKSVQIGGSEKERKNTPIYGGLIQYFPLALREVAKASAVGNDQHFEGTPLHWDKNKSADNLGSLTRHLFDHASGELEDSDGVLHLTKVAWRALAALQIYLEDLKENGIK